MTLGTGVMVLKQHLGNNIQRSFPDLWSSVNDIEEDLDKKAFFVTSLKNVVDNLNITDLQRKIIKVEATMKTLNKQMQQQFDYWKALGKNWLPLIQANADAIKDLKSKTENFISPNINDSSHSIGVILN